MKCSIIVRGKKRLWRYQLAVHNVFAFKQEVPVITHPCNIQIFLKLYKSKIFIRTFLTVFFFFFFFFFAKNIDLGRFLSIFIELFVRTPMIRKIRKYVLKTTALPTGGS